MTDLPCCNLCVGTGSLGKSVVSRLRGVASGDSPWRSIKSCKPTLISLGTCDHLWGVTPSGAVYHSASVGDGSTTWLTKKLAWKRGAEDIKVTCLAVGPAPPAPVSVAPAETPAQAPPGYDWSQHVDGLEQYVPPAKPQDRAPAATARARRCKRADVRVRVCGLEQGVSAASGAFAGTGEAQQVVALSADQVAQRFAYDFDLERRVLEAIPDDAACATSAQS